MQPRRRLHRALHQGLALRVETARRLVEEQGSRAPQQGSCKRNALFLAAREREAAVSKQGVVGVGQRDDECVDLGGAAGGFDGLVGCRLGSQG